MYYQKELHTTLIAFAVLLLPKQYLGPETTSIDESLLISLMSTDNLR